MHDGHANTELGCTGCRSDELPFAVTFAFQPIVDVTRERIESYEALVRGTGGEPAAAILARVDERSRYRFDQTCRVTAIALAARLGLATKLNLNFMPGAVYRPELCIRTTLAAALAANFPIDRIVFEVVENEEVGDPEHLRRILHAYRKLGFSTAIDDFGAGHSGLALLADFQPDLIKLDMQLVRGIDGDPPRQAIARAVVALARDLGIRIVAEGVETMAEYDWLADASIELFQGYLFARPGFESLPTVDFARFRRERRTAA